MVKSGLCALYDTPYWHLCEPWAAKRSFVRTLWENMGPLWREPSTRKTTTCGMLDGGYTFKAAYKLPQKGLRSPPRCTSWFVECFISHGGVFGGHPWPKIFWINFWAYCDLTKPGLLQLILMSPRKCWCRMYTISLELGIRLDNSNEGGIHVQNGVESSVVVDVKAKKDLHLLLVELKR